jgi:hypothetical protein
MSMIRWLFDDLMMSVPTFLSEAMVGSNEDGRKIFHFISGDRLIFKVEGGRRRLH